MLRTYNCLKVKAGREGDEHQTDVAPIRMKIRIVIAATKECKGSRQESETRSVNEVQVQETRAVIGEDQA